jgi:hypothetical protein
MIGFKGKAIARHRRCEEARQEHAQLPPFKRDGDEHAAAALRTKAESDQQGQKCTMPQA